MWKRCNEDTELDADIAKETKAGDSENRPANYHWHTHCESYVYTSVCMCFVLYVQTKALNVDYLGDQRRKTQTNQTSQSTIVFEAVCKGNGNDAIADTTIRPTVVNVYTGAGLSSIWNAPWDTRTHTHTDTHTNRYIHRWPHPQTPICCVVVYMFIQLFSLHVIWL